MAAEVAAEAELDLATIDHRRSRFVEGGNWNCRFLLRTDKPTPEEGFLGDFGSS